MALDFSEGLPLDVVALRDVAHDFAVQKLRQAGIAADRTGDVPFAVLREAGELGLWAPNVPEALGGPGVSALAQTAMMEELGWGSLGIALGIGTQALCAEAVLRAGDDEQKKRLLPGLCGAQGLALGALALTEPQVGGGQESFSEEVPNRTIAVKADGGYRLDGRKVFVANGGEAKITVLLASAPDGDSLFALGREAEGFTLVRRIETAGLRALQLAEISLSGCSVPAQARLGAAPGDAAVAKVLALGRTLAAAGLVGTARAAFEEAHAYARTRHTFRKPIIEHEQVGGALAQMRARIQAARLMVYRAAGDLDAGRDAGVSSAEAAFLAGEIAVGATRGAVQAFGGYGFTQEFPAEMWLRDAVGGRLAYGTGDLQLMEAAQAIAAGA
ncbi:MAG: acyl-CoA dehydrogenase family protein [Thermaerobacter sp.]|nr:acyl-CoA dehydrogenase family protein [Thermaerobacter sp.]